jgi:heme-degrading monooxygenase HmoA
MYAIVTRRKMNQARVPETRERAATEFWPKLQQAPGFVSFSLIQSEDGVGIAIVVFEDKAHAADFASEGESWATTLNELGHQIESRDEGEVTQHITASS